MLWLVFTEPLGGVKKLQVTDPTTSALKVRWDPAEGNVRQYRIFYTPATGGVEDMVRCLTLFYVSHLSAGEEEKDSFLIDAATLQSSHTDSCLGSVLFGKTQFLNMESVTPSKDPK